MKVDWKRFLQRLDEYPTGTHLILPPCTSERLGAVERDIGPLPGELVEMLRHFSGAQLFNKSGPLVSIFGITTEPPLPALEWFPDWHIDKFTPIWRAKGHARDEWPIAMMNYGVLIVLNSEGCTKDWDTSQGGWVGETMTLHERIESMMHEGDLYLSEE